MRIVTGQARTCKKQKSVTPSGRSENERIMPASWKPDKDLHAVNAHRLDEPRFLGRFVGIL